MRNTRPISWIKAARKDFEEFPEDVQGDMMSALTIAAEGSKSDKAKPFKTPRPKTTRPNTRIILTHILIKIFLAEKFALAGAAPQVRPGEMFIAWKKRSNQLRELPLRPWVLPRVPKLYP